MNYQKVFELEINQRFITYSLNYYYIIKWYRP